MKKMEDRDLMLAALDEARAALSEEHPCGEVPVGAAIMKDGILLAAARNRCQRDSDPTAHAEIAVLREAGKRLGDWRLEGCILAVTLEPCPMCAAAIRRARVAKLLYGARDARGGACGSALDLLALPGFGPEVAVEGGLEGEACALLLRDFFERRRGNGCFEPR